VQAGPTARLAEDERPRHETGRVGPRVVGRVERALGLGDVPRLRDEAPELADRDRMTVDVERADRHAADRALLQIEAL
jgi:hypothetical protein